MSGLDDQAAIDAHLRFPFREQAGGQRRCCDWPGCAAAGQHRAPRSRERLRDYLWFCLEHVREYNRHWDYFAGMRPEEIDAYRREDVTWHRPTWPGHGGRHGWAGPDGRFRDPFDLLEDGPNPFDAPLPRPDGQERRMMAVLGLEHGFTRTGLKRRYSALVKALHPDLNGGDRGAEERLRRVIEAYRFLRALARPD
jgi:hypothetical protein